VDGAISFGSEFRLPAGLAYVTLDDATIVQLRRSWSYAWMQAVSDDSLRRMIARQQRIFLRARACCCVTHWTARSAIEDYGVPEDRVAVVGCGPNRELTATDRDFTVPRFLFVGKDFERKNGPAVVRAFAEVRRHHPQATLDVVGDHPLLDAENVVGHGMLALDRPDDVARVNELYARATCFVMPSRFEPAGYVFAEALATGVGSIGTTHGGSSTIIGDAGVTVRPDDVRALTEQMQRFCDPDDARSFAVRARARAPLFTWRAAAERLVRTLGLDGFDREALAAPL
jgi:glycosyltransferase involved in cell wall biosynthesis